MTKINAISRKVTLLIPLHYSSFFPCFIAVENVYSKNNQIFEATRSLYCYNYSIINYNLNGFRMVWLSRCSCSAQWYSSRSQTSDRGSFWFTRGERTLQDYMVVLTILWDLWLILPPWFCFCSFGRFVILFEFCMNACARRSLVWGHFCLCYEGEKLIDDKAYIRVVGIKDGDQVWQCSDVSLACLLSWILLLCSF